MSAWPVQLAIQPAAGFLAYVTVLAMAQLLRAHCLACCRCRRARVRRHQRCSRCIRRSSSPSLAAGGSLHDLRQPSKLTTYCIPHVADTIARLARAVGSQTWSHFEPERRANQHTGSCVAVAVPDGLGGSGSAREYALCVSPLSALITRMLAWRWTRLNATPCYVVLASWCPCRRALAQAHF